ncbi:MAG: hypothetical protein LLF75_09815 [Eubacteriales bacterium]|nr:hypothetical protein [Eubacteriales bacterium]
MEQQLKKNKRVWPKVLITIFAVLLILPLALYAYLSYDHFQIDDKRVGYDYHAPYAGEAIYRASGDVEIPLAAEDLYWLIDEYRLLDDLGIPDLACRKIAVEIGDSALTIYANIRYKGFLPLPLRADLSIQTNGGLKIDVVGIHVGKWINLPAEQLAKYGVETHYSVLLKDLLRDSSITSIAFKDGKIVATAPFLTEFSESAIPDMTADTLLLYGAEADGAIDQASACYRAETIGIRERSIRDYVAGAPNPVVAMMRLLALCDTTNAEQTIQEQDAFRTHFFLPASAEDISAYRETYLERIVSENRKLETLLTAVREKYKALEIRLTRDAYVDTVTNEALSLAALCPAIGLDNSQCHPILLLATEPQKAPYTADLQPFSQIPKSPGLKLDMTQDYLRNDIGVMLVLPGGSTAMLYYTVASELMVQCLPQETAASLFEEYRAPKVLNLDLAVFSTKRVLHDAPTSDLSPYIVFLPWDIEKTWNAMSK